MIVNRKFAIFLKILRNHRLKDIKEIIYRLNFRIFSKIFFID